MYTNHGHPISNVKASAPTAAPTIKNHRRSRAPRDPRFPSSRWPITYVEGNCVVNAVFVNTP